ncbi:LOW QUALITY PROTEIN: hypothetical protein Cgig2_030137 [Carnegiea gigantea]|uniref:DUF8040 domain-containing protein n=1 Tax=Carnegiea gigantea TaxID=171969 RepID=A0A9Q1K101_9CARY|nr:LOW QUALITY PROTEIN: hypothetical protein Cgig2_030137 [Carnegiea gigantea]
MKQNVPLDLKEHMGDSDKGDEDDSIYQHTSEGGSFGDRRRLRQQFADSVRCANSECPCCAPHKREPSPYQQVLTKLRQHPGVVVRGPDFTFSVMEYIRREKDGDYFVLFDDEDISRYLQVRGFGDQAPSSHQRLPKITGGKGGSMFIHQVSYGNRPDCCRQLVRLEIDAFTHLVNVMIEEQLLDKGSFVKVAEIVAISLYFFTRGASYRDVQIRLPHSPSTISKYHNQVLQALVNLSIDIVKPHQS